MTACVNKHTKKVAAVISASLVGALSLGVAVPAFAAEGVDMQAEASSEWEGVELSWNGTYDTTNGYWTIPAGETFALTGAKAADGTAVSMSDLTVVYVANVGKEINWPGDGAQTVSTVAPTGVSEYHAIVINGKPWIFNDYTTLNSLQSWFVDGQVKDVYVKVQAKSLEGAYAFENGDVTDTTFKYTGAAKTVGFADASGNVIDPAKDGVDISWDDDTLDDAGTYTATLKGDGTKYSGTATVKVTVEKIDLAKDVITVDPVVHNNGVFYDGTNSGILNQSKPGVNIYVNGEPLADGIVVCQATSVVLADGSVVEPASSYQGNGSAKISLKVTPKQTLSGNFVDLGASQNINMVIADALLGHYFYDNQEITGSSITLDSTKGEAFDPAKVTCAETVGGKSVDRTVTVTRDGKTTDDYSTPGTLTVRVDVKVPENLKYAGSKTFTVEIIGKHYGAEPKAYVSIDGKDVTKFDTVEYDGEAVVPAITVKSGSAVVDAADYTVAYTDKDGKAVEGDIVEPGEYTGTISFGGATFGINGANEEVEDITFTFEVTKATIRSAKADKDLYAATGEAVTPKFTAYTGEELDGLSVEIDPAVTGVSYYKAVERTWPGNPFDPSDDVKYWDKTGDPIKASDLKKAGHYIAVVTVPADDPHFQGSHDSEVFEIAEYAKYSDVDASAWYAQDVYNAAELGYMTGIKGTDLFMPLADISRAELAQVFANMAGEVTDGIYTPTAFADVDAFAWYAEPVAWASEAGIVTGYDADTFGPMDKASREQVATMLYRYAKAQGKDVSVKDTDAALSAYKDGDQVSDWAKTAMAWAVENGIFGVDTDELWANQNIQRAAVASIAVRFQPEALPEA